MLIVRKWGVGVGKNGCRQAVVFEQAGALDYAGGFRNCPDAQGRSGGHVRRLGGWCRRNLSAGCGGAFHPVSEIIFNEAHAAVPAGRGKCVAIVPHASFVALVAALSTIKVSFYDGKHDFIYQIKATVLSKVFLQNN